MLLGLFALTRKAARRGRQSVRNAVLIGGMGTIVAASFAWSVVQSMSSPASSYFSTFTRVWELGIGALVAIIGPALAKLPGAIRPTLHYIGLAGVAASLILITETTRFPGPGAALPVFSTALVVAAYHGVDLRGKPMLTNRVALYFGKTSYSLYVWHWPVIVVLAAMMPAGPAYYIIATILALGLSHGSFTYFEDRIRRSKWLERNTEIRWIRTVDVKITPQAWHVASFITVFAILFAILSLQLSSQSQRVGEEYESLYVSSDMQRSIPADPCLGAAALASNTCTSTIHLDALNPGLDKFAKDTQGAYSCWRYEGKTMPQCNFGSNRDDALRVALIGDSHAAMMLPALGEFLIAENWNLTSYVGYGCGWTLKEGGDCANDMRAIQDRLLNDEPYDMILTTGFRKFGDVSAYASTWAPVVARGTKVVAITDNPMVNEDAISCLTRFGSNADDIAQCGLSVQDATAEVDRIVEAAKLVPGVAVVDLMDLYCVDGWCPSVIGNVVVYRDTGGHLTASYAKTLAPYLVERINAIR